ncbi:tRNA (adenosine(37)-N6)-threonylcarbamoyltransferase complex dimerization subunit type 1 TsaB [Thermoproteota archaeon]
MRTLPTLCYNPEMIFLGIHLACEPYSIGIISDEGGVFKQAESSVSGTHTFGENLFLEIDALCKRVNVSAQSLNAVCLTQGPGSYTGLRIGITTAKSISQTLGIPIYPISTLESQMLPFQTMGGVYCSVTPARKNEFNAALFASDKGIIKRLTPDFIWNKAVMKKKLSEIHGRFTVIGSISEDFSRICKKNPNIHIISCSIRGLDLAREAKKRFLKGAKGLYQDVTPLYSYGAV